MNAGGPVYRYAPRMGCAALILALILLVLFPLLLVDAMQTALERLGMTPLGALFAVLGIFIGSLVNFPVYRIKRVDEQPIDLAGVFGFWGPLFLPRFRRVRRDTVIAVNAGGCVLPLVLAVWQVTRIARAESGEIWVLAAVASLNIAACYFAARPVAGVGIAMPAWVSPLVSVGLTWLFLGVAGGEAMRAPIAFTAGVLGPLVGADLLRLKDITRVSTGMLSIGGAGTFDGIVLSGVLAALLA